MAATVTAGALPKMETIKTVSSHSSSGSGEWGVAPKKLKLPSLALSPSQTSKEKRETTKKHASPSKANSEQGQQAKDARVTHEQHGGKSEKSSTNTNASSKKPGKKATLPREGFDDRWAEQMSPAEKAALLTNPGNLITVRGQPGYGFEIEANAQKPKRGHSQPLALAYQDAPQRLLVANFGLARKLLHGPKRTWNLFNEHACNVYWLVEWAVQDAQSPAGIDVDLSACCMEDIITLWATSATMQCKRARLSIARQFRQNFLPKLDLEATLDAWHVAREFGVQQAERDLKVRLHDFAWAKHNKRSALPFVDVEAMFNSAPDETFTIAAMMKLARSMANRNPELDSQFHAMSKEFQNAWMNMHRDFKLQADLKNAARSASDQQRARANFRNTERRGNVPHKPNQAFCVIGHNPYI